MKISERYALLREQYPEYVGKEQLRLIAHISKKTARNLLISGLIPCKNTGKKTRNYIIALSDIAEYLEEREICPEKYKLPSNNKAGSNNFRISVSEPPELVDRWRKYYEWRLWEFEDLLLIADVTDVTGYSPKAIYKWIKDKKLKAFHKDNHYIVPKTYLIEYMSSAEYRKRTYKSLRQIRDIGGFIKWQEQKS